MNMKKLLFLLIAAALVLCSCGKNYPKLVKQQVEKYMKEGKIILSQSNDSTGKEHYIVFADMKAQTIGVDTLGEKVQTINLSKILEKQIDVINVQSMDTFSIIVYDHFTGIQNAQIKITGNKTFTKDNFENWKATVYKDKYIILINKIDEYDIRWSILWLGKPEYMYTYRSSNKNDVTLNKKDGDIKINIKSSEAFSADYGNEWIQVSYNATFDCNGEIKKQDDYVNFEGINIPISAYGDENALLPYIERIQNGIEERYRLEEMRRQKEHESMFQTKSEAEKPKNSIEAMYNALKHLEYLRTH